MRRSSSLISTWIGLVDLRRNVDRGERSVPALGGVEGRDAHQPVHAALAGELAEGVFADDGEGGRLDARLFAVLIVVHLGLEALLLGPAQIHAHQHLGPVLALGAAGAGMHGDDGVQRVGLAAEHGARFERFGKGAEFLDARVSRSGENILAFARQLEVGLDIARCGGRVPRRRRPAPRGACGRASAACEAAGSDHSAGSASFVSISESSLRMRAGSKILPQVAHLVTHRGVGEFEIV